MQASTSISSLDSSASGYSSSSSSYGSRTVLDARDLSSAAPRCRSSIVCYDDIDLPSSVPPPRPPRTRRSALPSTTARPAARCRRVFRSCLSSVSSPLALSVQGKKVLSSSVRQRYFAKLSVNHPVLLVLSDYECQCGCRFSMKQGSFVIQYDGTNDAISSRKKRGVVTVISSDLVCSKVPMEFVCDVDVVRERVRARRMQLDERSFDL